MSTETFLRLPEEKRNRVLDAAWEEFTRVRYTDVSINKIILKARIPRGSFYQYFSDKEDLFAYLVDGIQEEMMELFLQFLKECRGDLFRLFPMAYDRFLTQNTAPNPALTRYSQLVKLNAGMDLEKIIPCRKDDEFMASAWKEIDASRFRRKEPEEVRLAFSMMVMAFGVSIMEGLNHPEEKENQRRELERRLDILRYGCLCEDNKEEL